MHSQFIEMETNYLNLPSLGFLDTSQTTWGSLIDNPSKNPKPFKISP